MAKKIQKVSDIHNFWKWWSVRLGILSGALSATASAYGAMLLISPTIVADIPKPILTGLAVSAMVTAFLSVWARGVVQPGLSEEKK